MEDRAAKFCDNLDDNLFDSGAATEPDVEADEEAARPVQKPGFRFGRRAKPSPTAKIITPEERAMIDEFIRKNGVTRIETIEGDD